MKTVKLMLRKTEEFSIPEELAVKVIEGAEQLGFQLIEFEGFAVLGRCEACGEVITDNDMDYTRDEDGVYLCKNHKE